LDRSADCLFLNLFCAAKVECNRRTQSTQPLSELKEMDAKDKQLAEAILRRLCANSQIGGIRFGPVLQILISHVNQKGDEPIYGQVYLNLGSRWKVFDSRPISFPNSEDELPEASAEKQIQTICDLRDRTIIKAELGENEPHLILTLDDARLVFVNGKHDMYESWDVGVAFSGEVWKVIACPGGGVAIWAPKTFLPGGA
jgi:hypothetical protein